MKKTIQKIQTLTLSLTIGLFAIADVSAAGKGESGGQFLRVGVGARASALAGAFGPIADDVTSIYWNPAGLARMEKREVSLSYNAYFEDTAAQFLGYGHPTESKGTWAGSVRLLSVDEIERRSATGGDADIPDLGSFDTQDMAISLAWANHREMMSGRLNYGLSLKYISSDLETESAQTAAVDLGSTLNFNEDASGFSLSFAVLNLGGELKFKDEGDPLPLNIKPGMAYQFNFERMGRLSAVLDSDIFVNDGIAFVQPGFEWWAHRIVALRGGYQIGRDEDAGEGFGVGLGFRFQGLGVDYAFVPFGELGDTHRMSLGFKF